jgi:hypothetical protein
MTSTEPTTIVKLSTPADIVGAVPAIVGFHPTESLVVICLNGPRKRQGLTMRYDLPAPDHEEHMATDVANRVAAQRADAVLLVCFTADPDDQGELPRRQLIDLVVAALNDRGIGHAEVLLSRESRWYSYTCAKPCCPREGTPLPDVPTGAATEYAANRVLHGRAVLDDRETLEKSVAGPVALRRIALGQRFEEAADAFITETDADGAEKAYAKTLELASSVLATFEEGRPDVDDRDACRILVGLSDLAARDALIVWGVDDDEGAMIAFLTALAQLAVDEIAAPICAVLATVAYMDGNGALANVAVERALRCDPTYSMAQLVETALAGALHPKRMRRIYRKLKDEFPRPVNAGTNRTDGTSEPEAA